MPNFVTNRLTIFGDDDKIAELFTKINGGKNEQGQDMLIDFNKLIPMPEPLKIESGSQGHRGLELYNALCKKTKFPLKFKDMYNAEQLDDKQRQILDSLIIGEQYYNNIRDYGYPTWYEWALSDKNWGTKWNAGSQKRISGNCIEFQTAWSGAPNVITKLAEMFPSLSFSYIYADQDIGNNTGEYIFQNGACADVYIPKDGTPGAFAIAMELLGELYQEEENYEDEDDMEI
ncbi:MAG: hypothetical protein FWD23_17210 [Oscillospiraceae bacterium]|nr:hypothetical protein [Oscillospiraceae bacterium]